MTETKKTTAKRATIKLDKTPKAIKKATATAKKEVKKETKKVVEKTTEKVVAKKAPVVAKAKKAKPSTVIKEGDIIEIQFANRSLKARIINIADHVRKENAKDMYEIIEGEEDKE